MSIQRLRYGINDEFNPRELITLSSDTVDEDGENPNYWNMRNILDQWLDSGKPKSTIVQYGEVTDIIPKDTQVVFSNKYKHRFDYINHSFKSDFELNESEIISFCTKTDLKRIMNPITRYYTERVLIIYSHPRFVLTPEQIKSLFNRYGCLELLFIVERVICPQNLTSENP